VRQGFEIIVIEFQKPSKQALKALEDFFLRFSPMNIGITKLTGNSVEGANIKMIITKS